MGLELFAKMPYIDGAGLPDMTINARVISGLDPGAVPGGSTINPSTFGGLLMGPK